MSLVNYGSSSESEASDVESTPQEQHSALNTTSTKRSLSSLLPPPTKKKTVYVDLPKVADDDADEDEPKPKRTKISTGLGLADLLPKPKNTPPAARSAIPVTKTTTDKAFVPYALAKKMREKGKTAAKSEEEIDAHDSATTVAAAGDAVNETAAEKENEDDEDESTAAPASTFTGPFFKVGKELQEKNPLVSKAVKPALPALGPTMTAEKPKFDQKEEEEEEEGPVITAADAYAYDPNAMYSADPNIYYQYQYQQQQEEAQDNSNDIDLERLVGRKAKGEGNIQFKTINQQDILPSEEWRAAQTLTQAPKFQTGPAMQVSKMQAKKNNIMALAAHAVNNQERLDEMFAANKRSKRDASKKYGF